MNEKRKIHQFYYIIEFMPHRMRFSYNQYAYGGLDYELDALHAWTQKEARERCKKLNNAIKNILTRP